MFIEVTKIEFNENTGKIFYKNIVYININHIIRYNSDMPYGENGEKTVQIYLTGKINQNHRFYILETIEEVTKLIEIARKGV